jgi:predicted ATP-dependent serine protease
MAPELVGRASEIPVVESLLAGIADGGGSLLVLGDPGIGKSALVEAASRRAADAGIRVLACAGCRARRSSRSPGCGRGRAAGHGPRERAR